jgi:hypothetical protein
VARAPPLHVGLIGSGCNRKCSLLGSTRWYSALESATATSFNMCSPNYRHATCGRVAEMAVVAFLCVAPVSYISFNGN